MNIKNIISKLKECDDFHNRCDYLLEHDEITYLLEYIEELEQEKEKYRRLGFKYLNEKNEQLQERIDKAIEYLESYNTDFKNCRFGEAPISMRELGDLLEILKGEE